MIKRWLPEMIQISGVYSNLLHYFCTNLIVFSRTIYDAYNDRKIVLSEREMELIRRIQKGAFAHPEFEAYPEYVPYFTSKKEIHAFGNDYAPKTQFVTSKWEVRKGNIWLSIERSLILCVSSGCAF